MHRIPLLLLIASLAGCATGAGVRPDVMTVQREVDGLRRQAARDRRTIDELENRVFVLEDRLEKSKLVGASASYDPPQLPVEVRRADDAARAESVVAAPAIRGSLDELGEGIEIVYAGDAARLGQARAGASGGALSLEAELAGTPARLPTSRRADEPSRRADEPSRRVPPEPTTVSDRIPVTRVAALPEAARVAALPEAARVAALPEAARVAALPEAAPDDPASIYRVAYAALRRREHAEAVLGFRRLLDGWPLSEYADNAQYWIADMRYAERDYRGALDGFREVLKNYPTGNKMPDALLKIGFCFSSLGDAPTARDVFAEVIHAYPKSNAAGLAARRLEELGP